MLFSKSFLSVFIISLSITLTFSSLPTPDVSAIQVHLPKINPIDGHPSILRVCGNEGDHYKLKPYDTEDDDTSLVYACWDNGENSDCHCEPFSPANYPDFEDKQNAGGVANDELRAEWFKMIDRGRDASGMEAISADTEGEREVAESGPHHENGSLHRRARRLNLDQDLKGNQRAALKVTVDISVA